MNKTELIKAVATKANVSKTVAAECIGAFVDVVEETLMEGDNVQLIGFGTFTPADRAARTAINPQTGEVVDVPARKVPTFKPSKNFKELLR